MSSTAAETEGQGGSGKKKLLIIIIAVVVLLGGGGGAAFFLMKPHDAEAGAEPEKETKKVEALPIYEKVDTFVVNLSGAEGTVLQTDLQVQLNDEKDREVLKAYMPKVRSNLILLLSSKTPAEIATAEGKELLKKQIRQVVNDSVDADHKMVKSVLFTSFIIQAQ